MDTQGQMLLKAILASPAATDVTDSESESDTFLKSIGYLKSDRVGFEIFISVQLYKFE